MNNKIITNSEEIFGRKIIGSMGYSKVIFRFKTSKIRSNLSASIFCPKFFRGDGFDGLYVKSTKRVYAECDIKKNELYENILKHLSELEKIKAKDIYCKVYTHNDVLFIKLVDGLLYKQDPIIEQVDSLVNVGTAQYRLERELEGDDYLYIRFKPKEDDLLYSLDKMARKYIDSKNDKNFDELSEILNTNCKKNEDFSYIETWNFPYYKEKNNKYKAPLEVARSLSFLEKQDKYLIFAFKVKDFDRFIKCNSLEKKEENVRNLVFFFHVLSKQVNAFVVQHKKLMNCAWTSDGEYIQEFEYNSECSDYE